MCDLTVPYVPVVQTLIESLLNLSSKCMLIYIFNIYSILYKSLSHTHVYIILQLAYTFLTNVIITLKIHINFNKVLRINKISSRMGPEELAPTAVCGSPLKPPGVRSRRGHRLTYPPPPYTGDTHFGHGPPPTCYVGPESGYGSKGTSL